MKTQDENEKMLTEGWSRRTPYKVPEGYFEDFTAKMEAKLDEVQQIPYKAPSKPAVWWSYVKPVLYVAAMVAVIYGATYLIVQPRLDESARQAQLAQVEEMINDEEFVLLADDWDEDDVYELYDEMFCYNQ
ncbi:MAG: hypothetical protein J6Y77_00450 [Paludibacteraceae bacterium]|nr:hypothetical protein [Paludibacteraceae bacterium]